MDDPFLPICFPTHFIIGINYNELDLPPLTAMRSIYLGGANRRTFLSLWYPTPNHTHGS